MQLIETMLGRLGSRFTLHFVPKNRQVFLGPLGKFFDLPFQLRLGFRAGANTRLLPFAGDSEDYFPEVEMELRPSSILFHARDRALNLYATFTFTAPFYPQDEPLSLAPFFYLDVTLDRIPNTAPLELVAELGLPEGQAEIELLDGGQAYLGATLTTTYRQVKTHWGPRTAPGTLSEQAFHLPIFFGSYGPTASATEVAPRSNTLALSVSSPAGEEQPALTYHLLLATYVNQSVLEVRGVKQSFRYNYYYKDLAAVLDYAVRERAHILEKTAFFENIWQNSSLGHSYQNLMAFTFQSYITNTWWTLPDTASLDRDWYSVWEGNCVFHSTVDVEYNLSWFYLLLWPQLLEKTLAEWGHYLHEDERGTWLSHDIGGVLEANHQTYPHQMEVEENCNFILLVYALWRYSGNHAVVTSNLEVVTRLVRFVLDSDTTGNGFPDRGIANTIDDASPAVQYGKEQVYLAVKALSACWATARLLEAENSQPKLAAECAERVKLIGQTLDNQAWLGDHYAVTLDRTTEGLVNPWTGEPLEAGELEGWDGYSLYTNNGLLYLLACAPGGAADLPPLELSRIRQDLEQSLQKSLIEYGCTHSSADKSNIWISQNLHRDAVAGYLGLDLSDMVERYWAFEQFENGEFGRGGCFVDTYGNNHLRLYPRGLTCLGLLYASAGARVDRQAGRLFLQPARVPLRIPLLSFADWPSGRVPYLSYYLENGTVRYEIENRDLLGNLTVDFGGSAQ
ncbi:MAG TPA: DUF4965 domain-containing protein [Chloroflexia bacterium]|nr:DUF4965 domain-containing protein [Chloroflexia bacterium]